MEHLMGESVEKRRRIPLGSENGCFSFHLDLLWPTERTILVEMENFHLLLSSPPRWQDERNALGRNLCLISISGIPSTSLSFASYLVSEQTKNRTIKESYRTRSFCHERYTISSDIILHAVYFTRCWVSCSSKSRKDFISAFHCPYVEEHSNEVNFFLGKEAVRKFGRSIHQCF